MSSYPILLFFHNVHTEMMNRYLIIGEVIRYSQKLPERGRIMKLTDYAKANSICYRTAWEHFRTGKIPGARKTATGQIVIDEPIVYGEHTVVYIKSGNTDKLSSQSQALQNFCIANGWVVKEVVQDTDILNSPRLVNLLKKHEVTRLVVESNSSISSFGMELIKALYPECEIITVKETEDKEELLETLTATLQELCGKIYGKRKTVQKLNQILKQVQN